MVKQSASITKIHALTESNCLLALLREGRFSLPSEQHRRASSGGSGRSFEVIFACRSGDVLNKGLSFIEIARRSLRDRDGIRNVVPSAHRTWKVMERMALFGDHRGCSIFESSGFHFACRPRSHSMIHADTASQSHRIATYLLLNFRHRLSFDPKSE
jgi:hypothetical protein